MTNYDRNARIVSPPAPLVGPRCRKCRRLLVAHDAVGPHDYDPMGIIEEREWDHVLVSNADGELAAVVMRLTRELDDLNDLVSQLRRDAGV